ncbi:MAG TPA: glycosyltransferase family 4 protein [Dehalococcoidia bacterium]|nr:glycosyltransferase family 4 protein [Dehalococcoidia bacterium]
MRILLVGINYAPEHSGNAPYTTGFAEHMAARGHDVHVLIGQPHYPSWRREAASSGVRNGVNVHRLWHYVPQSHSAARRAMYETSFLGAGASLLRLPRPDLVLGVVPILSDGMLARFASRRFDVPYGIIFQDLMGLAAAQSGLKGAKRVESIVRRAEAWLIRGATGIAVVADGFRPYLEAAGAEPQRIHRVRNWRHVPAASRAREAVRAEYGWREDEFVCLHAGNMGHKQGLENVIEAARLASRLDDGMTFVLAGDGNRRAELEALTARYRLKNVHFLPSMDADAYADLLSAADALVLNQSRDVTNMAFPSKVTSYVFSGRPIVAAVAPESDAGRELAEAGAAMPADPDAPGCLLEALQRLRVDRVLRQRLSRAALAYGHEHLTPEAALDRWEAFALSTAGVVEAATPEAAEVLEPVDVLAA